MDDADRIDLDIECTGRRDCVCDVCWAETRRKRAARSAPGAFSAHGARTSYGKAWRKR